MLTGFGNGINYSMHGRIFLDKDKKVAYAVFIGSYRGSLGFIKMNDMRNVDKDVDLDISFALHRVHGFLS